MSFISEEKNSEENQSDQACSDTESNYQTDDDSNSDESFSECMTKFKKLYVSNNPTVLESKKQGPKTQCCRLTVSLRYGKCDRQIHSKNKPRKIIKRKKCPLVKTKNCLEVSAEPPRKGKRCRLGGKAKGKPPEEENNHTRDSDEDSDNFYFGRISLGYFQKFKDESGASTSYELDQKDARYYPLCPVDNITQKTSEEMELQELQKWGKSAIISSLDKKIEELKSLDGINPDVF